MPVELSVLLIIVAGIGGFALGRSIKRTVSYGVALDSYDCETQTAVLTVTSGPQTLAAYAWDNSAGAAGGSGLPHPDSATASGSSGTVTISGVPHENNARKILLQIWGIDSLVEAPIDCDSSGSGSGSGNVSASRSPSTVLP